MQTTKQPSNPRIWPAIAFCAAAFAVSTLLYDRIFTTYDDGVAAEGARLILHGAVPYRDFWTMYAPASYYVNALMFAIFGESFLSMRMILPVLVIIQAGFLYGILRRTVRDRRWALLCAAAYLAFIPIGINITHCLTYWFTVAIAAAYLLIRWIEEPVGKWEYSCGACIGLSTLFRQDGGTYMLAVVIPLVYVLAPKLEVKRSKSILRVFGSFTVVVAIAFAYYAWIGALGAMIADIIRFAVVDFPQSRENPYPFPWRKALIMAKSYAPGVIGFIYHLYTFIMLPVILGVFAFISAARLRTEKLDRRKLMVASLSILAFALFIMVCIRPVAMRIAASIVFGLVVFAAYSTDSNKKVRTMALIMLIGAVVSFVPFAVSCTLVHRHYGRSLLIVKGGVMVGRGYSDLISLTSLYIRKHTKPDEKILSGTPTIYFTAGRDPATVYHEPHPCLTNRPDIQRTIINDLKRHKVRYIVRSCEWNREGFFTIEPECEPKQLVDYILRNYKEDADLGIFKIYKRKTAF